MKTLVLVLLLIAGQATALDWEEGRLAAGGRLAVVNAGEGGWAACVLAFPAGVSTVSDDPDRAQLAVRLLGETGPEGASFREILSELGWQLDVRVGQDLALLRLSGPAEDLPRIVGGIQRMFETRAEFSEADLQRARQSLEADRAKWLLSAELNLRSRMAAQLYGDHPYGLGSGKLAEGDPVRDDLAAFLRERFSPGGVEIVVAGDLNALRILYAWMPLLNRLQGPNPRPIRHGDPQWSAGRLESERGAPRELMLAQLPGLAPDHPDAPLLALSAGLIQSLSEGDIRDAKLALTASAWYRFNAAGPSHLEISYRGLAGGARQRAEAVLRRIVDRVRLGEFSEFMVISAKDRILNRLMEYTPDGQGPDAGKLSAVLGWTEEAARQQMLMDERRARFMEVTMNADAEDIASFASRWLTDERILIGILPAN